MAEGKNVSKKYLMYDTSRDKLIRKNPFCPNCKEGVFLARHKDRMSCGRCGYHHIDEVSEEE